MQKNIILFCLLNFTFFLQTQENSIAPTHLLKDKIEKCTAASLLKKLCKHPDPDIRAAVAKNPNTPLEILIKLSQDKSTKVKKAILDNCSITVDILQLLALDSNEEIKLDVASHKKSTPKILILLYKENSGKIKKALASNLNTPKNILKRLSYDIDERTRYCVASHPQTPVESLARLVHDSNFVKWGLIHNPNLPISVLEKLAKDSDEDIRNMALAKNPMTPSKVLDQLAEEEKQFVDCSTSELLVEIICNPNISTSSLKKLTNFQEGGIGNIAKDILYQRKIKENNQKSK